jgi:hypothetical protein
VDKDRKRETVQMISDVYRTEDKIEDRREDRTINETENRTEDKI